MNLERGLLSLFVGLFAVLIGLMFTLKKPLCIDSRIVEKIDRVSFDKTETIFRCSAFIRVPYSRYFDFNVEDIENRIESAAGFLKTMEPFNQAITLKINETQPVLFKINGHEIEIGSQLFKSQGHFERALFKVWLSERLKNDLYSQQLFAEVVADFLLYAYQGQVEIEDPLLKLKTKIGNSHWPQVLKSKETYCDSPWKISEHFSVCGKIQSDEILTSENLLLLSLRPLMTSVWIKAYADLPLRLRINFIQLLPRYLKSQELSSEKAIEMLMSDRLPLKQGMMNIKKMTDLMNSSSMVQNEKSYREFYAKITQNLQQAGVNDSFAEAYFDYLFEYPEKISVKSPLFRNLQKIAAKNPQLEFAVKDKSQIWILPSESSLPLQSYDQIKTQQHVFLACLGLREIEMKNFFNHAEKLLLIKGCDQNKNIDFEALVSKGIQSFSIKNKQLAFIQFHLPSFEMKAKELAHIKNFFELVNVRDVSKPEFQILGWSQVQWYEESQAYKPQAVVDAIELFRTETN